MGSSGLRRGRGSSRPSAIAGWRVVRAPRFGGGWTGRLNYRRRAWDSPARARDRPRGALPLPARWHDPDFQVGRVRAKGRGPDPQWRRGRAPRGRAAERGWDCDDDGFSWENRGKRTTVIGGGEKGTVERITAEIQGLECAGRCETRAATPLTMRFLTGECSGVLPGVGACGLQPMAVHGGERVKCVKA